MCIRDSGQIDQIGLVTFDDTLFNISSTSLVDSDGDGVPNSLDLDSDNDGISDLTEAGHDESIADVNGDGVIDDLQNADPLTNNDANNNGLSDAVELAEGGDNNSGVGVTPRASDDGDTIPDYLDLDSDGDSIPDATEARATEDYVAYNGTDDAADSDDDGILDVFDDNSTFGSTSTAFKSGNNLSLIHI